MYDDLVKRLRSVQDSWQTEEESWMLQAADAIEELSKPKWIPVTERLPEPGVDVLIYRPGCPGSRIEFAAVDGFVFDASLGKVTHWMPLPEPPREENHEKK